MRGLDPAFFRAFRPMPAVWVQGTIYTLMRLVSPLTRTRWRVEGLEQVPDGPVLFATNATHTYDFLLFRFVAIRHGRAPVVTVSKGKNHHRWLWRPVVQRGGVVPVGSRGYLIALDFREVIGRRPSDAEYRALRDHVDGGPEPVSETWEALGRSRQLCGWDADPARLGYAGAVRAAWRAMFAETARLAAEAVAAGASVHVYPEGTVSQGLGPGRDGAVRLAAALGLQLVPVGLDGARDVLGPGPWVGKGTVTVRFGEALSVPEVGGDPLDTDDPGVAARAGETTRALMARIDALLDPALRHRPGQPVRTGVDRFL